jgi:DNA-binding NarL/FixJ family response regulator
MQGSLADRRGPTLTATDTQSVLIVDDHAGFREGLREALVSCGFSVIGTASNGREALELAIELGPQVVLMDITMPVMGGIEATRLIRDKMPGVRVVALTMHDADNIRQAMDRAGASAFLNKSASIQEICDAIRAAAPN